MLLFFWRCEMGKNHRADRLARKRPAVEVAKPTPTFGPSLTLVSGSGISIVTDLQGRPWQVSEQGWIAPIKVIP